MPEPSSAHPPRRRVGVFERLRVPADGSPAQTSPKFPGSSSNGMKLVESHFLIHS
jgi:hypothetical protein